MMTTTTEIGRALNDLETKLLDLNAEMTSRTLWEYGEAKKRLWALIYGLQEGSR